MEQGIHKGEKQKEKEIVKKMLTKGFSAKDIIELSGMSIEEINHLKDSA